MDDKNSYLKPCPLSHYVSAGLRVNKTDPKILCLDCGLTLAATDWTTLYERWDSRSAVTTTSPPVGLGPHKMVNLLTVLEHQARRNHEYHPSNCGECAMTEQIASKLREQLGLRDSRS